MRRRRKMKKSDVYVICVLAFVLVFTIVCLGLFLATGSEPSTLIASVFVFCGCEAGILGWIKNTDTKNTKGDDVNG